jgi:hypothetical protein
MGTSADSLFAYLTGIVRNGFTPSSRSTPAGIDVNIAPVSTSASTVREGRCDPLLAAPWSVSLYVNVPIAERIAGSDVRLRMNPVERQSEGSAPAS